MPMPDKLLKKYEEERACQIFADREEIGKLGVKLYEAPVCTRETELVRHNTRLLAREIFRIYREVSTIGIGEISPGKEPISAGEV